MLRPTTWTQKQTALTFTVPLSVALPQQQRHHHHHHTPAVHPAVHPAVPTCTAARRAQTRRRRNRTTRRERTEPDELPEDGPIRTRMRRTRTRRVGDPTPDSRQTDLPPESCPALVLNADYSPLSYMPLSLWPWQEVIKAVFLNRVTVVATYETSVRSPGKIFPLPSVISLKEYQPLASKKPAFTRFNVFLRDSFACQYCGKTHNMSDLTFDHVVPKSCGGSTDWTNVVTACVTCNNAKGALLLNELKGVSLLRVPTRPTNRQLQQSARKFPPAYLHESWRYYVYWKANCTT